MDERTYLDKATQADRRLKRRWLPWLLGPLVPLLAVYVLSMKLEILLISFALFVLAIVLVAGSVVCVLYFRDHKTTSREMGLICTKCAESLLVPGVGNTKRCRKCKTRVIAG